MRLSSVEIESFPTANRSWAPTLGELWLVTATEQKKLCDIHDVAVSVAANSQNGDVTGELVDVGLGTRAADYAGKDLKGEGRDRRPAASAQIFALASRARRDRRGRLQHAVSRSRRRRHSLVQHRRQRTGLRLGRLAARQDTSWSRASRAAESCRSAP